MLKTLRQALATLLAVCVMAAGALALDGGQRGDQKQPPPKEPQKIPAPEKRPPPDKPDRGGKDKGGKP